MATRKEFIEKAIKRGASRDQIKSAMEIRRTRIGAFDDDKQEPPVKEDRNLFGLSDETERAVFPTTSESKGIGGAFMQGLEALGTPVRALGKFRTNPKTGEKFQAGEAESAFFRPEIDKLKGAIPGEGIPSKIGRGAIELTGSVLSDPTIPFTGVSKAIGKAGRKVVKSFGKGVVEAPNKFAGVIAKELSGVSEEALRMASPFSKGSKDLVKAIGTQKKIGNKILIHLDDYNKFLPEKGVIDNALNNMPSIKTKEVIKNLADALDDAAIGSAKSGNEKILSIIDDVSKMGDELPAKKFLDLRRKIDNEIGDSFGKESNSYITALKGTRRKMKEILIDAGNNSGNPEYAEAMNSLAIKMDAIDRLKGYIGKSEQARARKVEGFISNLFNKNKTDAQETIRDLGEVFGEDFLKESKLARLAGELGESGKPALLPRQTTGRSLLGTAGPQVALGSPFLASKFTLPAFTAAEKTAVAGTKILGKFPSNFTGLSGVASGLSPNKNTPQKKNITADTLKSLKFF